MIEGRANVQATAGMELREVQGVRGRWQETQGLGALN